MKSLFAPWRMEFIESHDPSKGCIFCELSQGEVHFKNQMVAKGKSCFVVLNKFPYSNGHLMVVPYRHESDWTKLTAEEMLELGELTQKSIQVIQQILKPQGFNLGVNLGKAAGAGIEAHVHQHVVPRWVGDINFMPLLGEVKIISEHLEVTYQKLRQGW